MQLNKIKSIILLTLSFLLITTSIHAQPGRGQQGSPPLPNQAQIADMIEELDEALDLSKGQKAQISALYFAHFEEVQKILDGNKTSPRDSRATMEALRKHFQADVKVLLNKDQVEKFESMQKHQRPPQQRQGRR